MKMKKITAIALALLSAGMLTACGSSQESTQKEETSS